MNPIARDIFVYTVSGVLVTIFIAIILMLIDKKAPSNALKEYI